MWLQGKQSQKKREGADVMNKLSGFLRRLLIKLVWKTAKPENSVFFSSFSGKSYSDNPKAISEKIHELDPSIKIIWLNRGQKLTEAPDYVYQVSRQNKIQYYRALASVKTVVENFSFPVILKNDYQMYIQTWHGDRAFKKVLYDSPFAKNINLLEAKTGFCDLALAGSDYGERQYRSAFHYNGKILKVGTPRDDVLLHVNDGLQQSIKKNIGLTGEYRYFLYAPTLRRANQNSDIKQNIQGIDIQETLDAFRKQYGGNWKCLLRAHPGVKGLTGSGTTSELVVDVSAYPDMTDLMIISDVLITDYSSCAGDFALLRKPVFLFQDDIEEYLKKDRNFYFDISDSPFLVAHSQDELITLIQSTTIETAALNCDDILKFYGTNETGEASTIVANLIIEHCRRL